MHCAPNGNHLTRVLLGAVFAYRPSWVAATVFLLTTCASSGSRSDKVADLWIHSSVNSAVIGWTGARDSLGASSRVFFGEGAYTDTSQYSGRTRNQFHQLTDLAPNTAYRFAAVSVDTRGDTLRIDSSFTTLAAGEFVHVPPPGQSPPYLLSSSGVTYLLTEDISAPGTAFIFADDAENAVLDLNGHTVTFGTDATEQVFGVLFGDATGSVCNGTIVQGAGGADYSTAVSSRWDAAGRKVYGIRVLVHRPNALPMKFLGRCGDLDIHHNCIESHVTQIESRHYPGNGLAIFDSPTGDSRFSRNILHKGCHQGVVVSSDEPVSFVVDSNDIDHRELYVNGYAIMAHAPGMSIANNRIVSRGRGIHITRADITVRNNHIDIAATSALDDLPAGSRPFQVSLCECHGIKLEGTSVRNASITGNFVRVTQYNVGDTLLYGPATPLNTSAVDPDGRSVVENNTFVALTEYAQAHHGSEYGKAGRWASALYFYEAGSPATSHHAIAIRNNRFVSNDALVGSATASLRMTLLIEDNRFLRWHPSTEGATDCYNLSEERCQAIRASNSFGRVSTLHGRTPLHRGPSPARTGRIQIPTAVRAGGTGLRSRFLTANGRALSRGTMRSRALAPVISVELPRR